MGVPTQEGPKTDEPSERGSLDMIFLFGGRASNEDEGKEGNEEPEDVEAKYEQRGVVLSGQVGLVQA